MEERTPLNPRKKNHGLEENSIVVTQLKKEHYNHVGILSGNLKDVRKDKKERNGCSGISIKKSIQKGEVRQDLLMYHER